MSNTQIPVVNGSFDLIENPNRKVAVASMTHLYSDDANNETPNTVCVQSHIAGEPQTKSSQKIEGFYKDHITEVLFSKDQIATRVKELGGQITADYKGKDLIVVGLLKGALPFMADLMRCIDLPCKIDMVQVKSYSGTQSTGVVKMIKDLSEDCRDKHIVIAEDLIDTGVTLKWLQGHFMKKDCASVKICCLLDKQTDKRSEDVHVDYVGFLCPDEFVIGYGMDFDETYRNMPCVAVLHPKMYTTE